MNALFFTLKDFDDMINLTNIYASYYISDSNSYTSYYISDSNNVYYSEDHVVFHLHDKYGFLINRQDPEFDNKDSILQSLFDQKLKKVILDNDFGLIVFV